MPPPQISASYYKTYVFLFSLYYLDIWSDWDVTNIPKISKSLKKYRKMGEST
jgi:hypothetical protein